MESPPSCGQLYGSRGDGDGDTVAVIDGDGERVGEVEADVLAEAVDDGDAEGVADGGGGTWH
jgi:hypothetical protein